VLVVGGLGVRQALLEVGLSPVHRADSGAVAILQGWSPDLAWATLAEGAFALADGLPWFVTNTDLTLPTDRGIAPGNGSFVALLSAVSGRSPDAVAGKPMPPLLRQASAKFSATHPIVVGDRLDTDIEGATAVGLPSLLVLSGVTDLAALLAAGPAMRPTFLAQDVAGLLRAHRGAVRRPGGGWTCGRWTAEVVTAAVEPGVDRPGTTSVRLVLTSTAGHDQSAATPGSETGRGSGPGDGDDGLDAVRATAAAAWASADEGVAVPVGADLLATLAGAGESRGAGSAEQGA
jgi:glycerol 3-phosphatase-2